MENWREFFEGKQLKRDPSERMLGGVCAGLAKYVGGDVVAWRLLVAVLAIVFTVPTLIIYIIWCIAVPADKEVTPKSRNGCLLTLLVLLVAGPVLVMLLPLLLSVPLLLGLVGWGIHAALWDGIMDNMTTLMQPVGTMLVVYVICAAVMTVLLVMLMSRLTKGERKGTRTLAVLLLLIPLLTIMSVWSIAVTKSVKYWIKNLPVEAVEWDDDYEGDEESFDSITDDDNYLKSWGWNLISNNSSRSTAIGEYYNGMRDYRYLEAHKEKGKLIYTVEHCDSTLEGGVYKLQAAVRADGRGACLYVRIGTSAATPDAKPSFERMMPIPDTGDDGGYMPDWTGDAKGWTLLTISDIPLKAGQTIYYGITTDPQLTQAKNSLDWFSACDFELIKD